METFLQALTALHTAVNAAVWGPPMLALLLGTGIYLTVRLRCFQLRRFPLVLRRTLGSLFAPSRREGRRAGDLTPFQAVSTALASTVGTGNIAGVTGAILLGGAGAVFWMWVSALFGMATKFSEIVLAVRYRQTAPDGSHYGGPMYYMEKGLGMPRLAAAFALFGGLACFGIGNIAQAAEISGAVNGLLSLAGRSVPDWAVGAVLAGLTGAALMGGVKRIGQIAGVLVPFMAVFYLLAGAAVICLRLPEVPHAFALILQGAFTPQAAAGGAAGYGLSQAIRQGVARGVFSNEAGLGSAPMAHASAGAKSPVEQGLWGVFEVFVDTILICTVTALTVILSGVCQGDGAFLTGGQAAAAAFNAVLPGRWGGIVLQVSMLFFSLTTILGWSCYGQRCWDYLSGGSPLAGRVYRLVYTGACFVGAVGSGRLMWSLSDTLNAMMAIPNLIALLLLSGEVAQSTRQYFASSRPGGAGRR